MVIGGLQRQAVAPSISGGFCASLWMLEGGFIEIAGALPVDCTPTIKSV